MIKPKFSLIGKVVNAFDSDRMNISRNISIENPDGSTGEKFIELYQSVPCHLTFEDADNPETNTNETTPIIVLIKIYCPVDVDLQNGDYVVVNRISDDGSVLETYQGNIGMPAVSISRQVAKLKVKLNA